MSSDAAFVGSIPKNYDEGLGPMIFVDYAAEMAQRAAGLKPHRVLEIAAGTGIVTRALRDALPSAAELVATDLNPPMLEVAKGKFKDGEKVAFQPADALALPFPDESFDALVCQFGVMFYPDKEKSYREAYRVLKRDGTYLLSVWGSHAENPYGRIGHETVKKFFPHDPPQFYVIPFSCHDVTPIGEGLSKVGFDEVLTEDVTLVKEIPDSTAFARGMVYGNPLYSQIMARGGVDPKEVQAAVKQALDREFGHNPGRMPIKATIIIAKK
jgi:ubiquinone/menaquinone biosynthesis C-methylase UbiE